MLVQCYAITNPLWRKKEKKFQKWILEDNRGKCLEQKFESLLMMQYILKYADNEHHVTTADIESHLLKYGIEV